jgi:hypothetical protein
MKAGRLKLLRFRAMATQIYFDHRRFG